MYDVDWLINLDTFQADHPEETYAVIVALGRLKDAVHSKIELSVIHRLNDDFMHRIMGFLDAFTLARISCCCTRTRTLALRVTNGILDGYGSNQSVPRDISVFTVLRSIEQERGLLLENSPLVKCPFQGLSDRMSVSNATPASLNGVYYCSGIDSNGFLFTRFDGFTRYIFGKRFSESTLLWYLWQETYEPHEIQFLMWAPLVSAREEVINLHFYPSECPPSTACLSLLNVPNWTCLQTLMPTEMQVDHLSIT